MIQVDLDNAAFHDGPAFNASELTRVLSKIEDVIDYAPYGKLDKEGNYGNLRDINGNKVGMWSIEPNPNRR